MLNFIKVFTFITLFCVSFVQLKDYSGYKFYKVRHMENVKQQIRNLVESEKIAGIDMLMTSNNVSHVLASPSSQSALRTALITMNATFDEYSDFESKISSEKMERRSGTGGFFSKIQPVENIQKQMQELVRRYSNISTYESLGKTYEGLDIGMVKISIDDKPKPKLLYIEAGLHAREWIAPSTALFFLTYILQQHQKIARYLSDVEINVVPLANPDGYKYTFTTDRMWRKNREPNVGSKCIGVDLNRNFQFHWKETGTSSDPCKDTFGGFNATSSREAKAISSYLLKNKNRLRGFVDLHSYGSYIFYPFGFKKNTFYKQSVHKTVSNIMAQSIRRVRGTAYEVGTAANLIYESAGGVDDFASGVVNVPLTFTIELPHDDFTISDSEIYPIGRETTVGLMELVKYIDQFVK